MLVLGRLVGGRACARAAANEAAENEHRRLLYVAMTRAADRLVICGATGERGNPPGCWYDLVHAALGPVAVEEPADDGESAVWRLRHVAEGEAAESGGVQTAFRLAEGRPAWLERNAPADLPAEQSLAPSDPQAESRAIRSTFGTNAHERIKALERGTLVHRLLQALPAIGPERRADAAQRYLARSAQTFSTDEHKQMVAQVCGILEDARFRELFEAGSRAEVPIVGRVVLGPRTVAVSGQVDRLAVTPGGVLIADFKTNRGPPRRAADIPAPYVRQLALYRAVLGLIYPDREVRAALVWTDVPDLMEVSADALDCAIATLTSP